MQEGMLFLYLQARTSGADIGPLVGTFALRRLWFMDKLETRIFGWQRSGRLSLEVLSEHKRDRKERQRDSLAHFES